MKEYDHKTIASMSIQERNDWIEAIDKLVGMYRKNDNSGSCPLCSVASYSSVTCVNSCLWGIFEGIGCSDFAKALIGSDVPVYCDEIKHVDFKTWNKWRNTRVPMLKIWREILQATL